VLSLSPPLIDVLRLLESAAFGADICHVQHSTERGDFVSTRRKAARWASTAGLLAALSIAAVPAHAATVHPDSTITPNLSCVGVGLYHVVYCSVAPKGGVAPYTMMWDNGPATSSTTFSGPCVDLAVVKVVVDDSAGNTGSQLGGAIC
jgi:hypothetical protein